jgi:hypothetical protein
MEMTELIEQLADAVHKKAATRFPVAVELWSVEQVSAYFHKTVPFAKCAILCKPSFPRPVKTDKKARPLYFGAEVVEWAKEHRG